LTEESIENPLPPIDKAAIDASKEGSWLIYSERSHVVSAEDFSNAVERMISLMEEHGTYVDLRPLRLILLTPELHDRAKAGNASWEDRKLGCPSERGILIKQ